MVYTDLANDFRFCREVTRKSASSFYYALRFLPAARRKALYAVYAFCRAVDDAVDETTGADAAGLVSEWRAELERCYRGMPLHPVTVALAASLEQFPIPKSALGAVIDGVEMDLVKRRYATFAELELYCWRVASAVGLASIEVFGYRNPATRDYAVDVGLALAAHQHFARHLRRRRARPHLSARRGSRRVRRSTRGPVARRLQQALLRAHGIRERASAKLLSLRGGKAAARRCGEPSPRRSHAPDLRSGARPHRRGALLRVRPPARTLWSRKVALAASMWVGSLLP